MTTFEQIDLILKKLPECRGKDNLTQLCNDLFGRKSLFGYAALEFELKKYELIEKTNSPFENEYQLTNLGKNIINDYGGLERYLNIKNGLIEKAERDIKKSKYDLALTKRQYYIFWVLFLLSLLGGISGFISIKSSFKSNDRIKTNLENRLDSVINLYHTNKLDLERQQLVIDSLKNRLINNKKK
jgi:hypothetical protein